MAQLTYGATEGVPAQPSACGDEARRQQGGRCDAGDGTAGPRERPPRRARVRLVASAALAAVALAACLGTALSAGGRRAETAARGGGGGGGTAAAAALVAAASAPRPLEAVAAVSDAALLAEVVLGFEVLPSRSGSPLARRAHVRLSRAALARFAEVQYHHRDTTWRTHTDTHLVSRHHARGTVTRSPHTLAYARVVVAEGDGVRLAVSYAPAGNASALPPLWTPAALVNASSRDVFGADAADPVGGMDLALARLRPGRAYTATLWLQVHSIP